MEKNKITIRTDRLTNDISEIFYLIQFKFRVC